MRSRRFSTFQGALEVPVCTIKKSPSAHRDQGGQPLELLYDKKLYLTCGKTTCFFIYCKPNK